MKTVPLKIGKRTFSIAFTLGAMCEMKKRPGFDLSAVSDLVKTPDGLLDLIFILAAEGEELEGRKLDVDRAWFGNHIAPAASRIAKIQIAVLSALAEGMKADDEDDQESAGESPADGKMG